MLEQVVQRSNIVLPEEVILNVPILVGAGDEQQRATRLDPIGNGDIDLFVQRNVGVEADDL